jgi:alpha-L-fucosidase
VTVNREGLVDDADVQRCREFGDQIKRQLGEPIGVTEGTGDEVELRLEEPATVARVSIKEDIRHGERVRRYAVDALVARDEWRTICEGESVGHRRLERIDPVRTQAVRLRCVESVAEPLISEFAVYA